jgi:hypothetical protein
VRGNQPHVFYRLLEIIATRWAVAPRLTTVSFGEWSRDQMPKTVSDLISQPALPGLESIIHTDCPIATPVTLTHLETLDTLAIPSCSWLNGELELPMRLRHLQIVIGDADSIPMFYGYLTDPKRHILRNHLRSIEVGKLWRHAVETIHPAEMKTWTTLTRLELPLLNSIKLNGVAIRHINSLLGCSIFPSLETASLCPTAEEKFPSHMMENFEDAREVSNFGPRYLGLCVSAYHSAAFIVTSLDVRNTERLSVRIRTQGTGQVQLPQRVSMPCLKQVVWLGHEDDYLHFRVSSRYRSPEISQVAHK